MEQIQLLNNQACSIQVLEARIDEKEQAVTVLQKTATQIENSLQSQTQYLVKTTKQIQEVLGKTQQSTTETTPATSPQKTVTPRTTTTHKTTQQQPSQHDTPKYRRTLFVRSRHAWSGSKIRETLGKENIAIVQGELQGIYTRKNQVEIIFTSEQALQRTQRELETHQVLNRVLDVVKKPPPFIKTILLEVPQSYEESHIKQTFHNNYPKLLPTECQILRKRESRQHTDTFNWIILLPIPLVQHIIHNGGVLMGLQRRILRPFTSIQRCSKCQNLEHTEARCTRNTYCSNCSGPHASEGCTLPPTCINCTSNNNQLKTTHNTDHQASDPNCPSYRAAFQRLRDKLDTICYGRNTQDTAPPQNNHRHFPQLPSHPTPLLPTPQHHTPLLPTPQHHTPLHHTPLLPTPNTYHHYGPPNPWTQFHFRPLSTY